MVREEGRPLGIGDIVFCKGAPQKRMLVVDVHECGSTCVCAWPDGEATYSVRALVRVGRPHVT